MTAVDLQCARTADGILEQLEQDGLIDREIRERHAFTDVASMEKHLASVGNPDEAVALPEDQRHDAAGTCPAAAFGWLRRLVLGHDVTSGARTGGGATGRRRTRRRSRRLSDALR
jgi:hypothetical protein